MAGKCEECKHSLSRKVKIDIAHSKDQVICRRNPPMVNTVPFAAAENQMGAMAFSNYPEVVRNADGESIICGEFQADEKQTS